jgi:hypothetical protein
MVSTVLPALRLFATPEPAAPPAISDTALMLEVCNGSSKRTWITALTGTPERPLSGFVMRTCGAVVDGAKPAVKVVPFAFSGLPARSRTPAFKNAERTADGKGRNRRQRRPHRLADKDNVPGTC